MIQINRVLFVLFGDKIFPIYVCSLRIESKTHSVQEPIMDLGRDGQEQR